jgi:hypothetical protein
MSNAKITVDEYNDRPRGAGRRCEADWMHDGKCRRAAKTVVTIESGGLEPKSSLLCWDCEDRVVVSYVREFRSELGRGYFGALTINGNEIKR